MSDSAEKVGSINDLLMQIWLRLPVKSLMRFKLVSRTWKCMITGPHFAVLWNPKPNPAVGLFYLGCTRARDFEYIRLDGKNADEHPPANMLRFPNDPFTFWLQQSCNGLLLCCSTETSVESVNSWFRGDSRLPTRKCYVYNPTTRCVAKLPRPGVLDGVPQTVHGVSLAFDGTEGATYNVVCVRGSEVACELFQIEIYSPESGVWRVSGEPFSGTADFDYGVYWNKSIHWVSYTPCEVVYFNVEEERFGKVYVPGENAGQEGRRIVLGESCGHMHMIQRYDIEAAFDVYELKRDYSEWFVKYRVDLTDLASAFRAISYTSAVVKKIYFVSLVVGKEGPYLVLHLSHKIVRFDLESNNYEEICDLEEPMVGGSSHLPCACEHIESLASV